METPLLYRQLMFQSLDIFKNKENEQVELLKL